VVQGGTSGHFEFAGRRGEAASGRVGRLYWDSIGPRGQGRSPPWLRRLRGTLASVPPRLSQILEVNLLRVGGDRRVPAPVGALVASQGPLQ
jgi:hypothetical protein